MRTLTDELVKEQLAQVSDIREIVSNKLSDDDMEQFNTMEKETADLLYKCVEIAYASGFRDGADIGMASGDCAEKENECVSLGRESHTISVEDMIQLLTVQEAYEKLLITLMGHETILGYDEGCLGAMSGALAVIENNVSKKLTEEDIDEILLDDTLGVEKKARKLLGMES